MSWNLRCRHLNVRDLKKLRNSVMVDLHPGGDNDDLKCEICARDKIHQLPYKGSATKRE